jgi:hypothetical protein
MSRRSESVDQIAPAFLKAQAAMKPVSKSASNPQFNSAYATLEDVMAACKQALADNNIAILQSGDEADDAGITVVTTLLHVSGQWIEGRVRLPIAKGTPQAAGSALTYGRRYCLAALVAMVADDDDDGNAASTPPKPAKKAAPKKKLSERDDVDLANLAKWAEREGKSDLLAKIAEEQERRRSA